MAETPKAIELLIREVDRSVTYVMSDYYMTSSARNPVQIDVTRSNGGCSFICNLLPFHAGRVTDEEGTNWKLNNITSLPPTNSVRVDNTQKLLWMFEDVLLLICRNTGHGSVVLKRKYVGNPRAISPEFLLVWYSSNILNISLTKAI
jgi:hypothetical protein